MLIKATTPAIQFHCQVMALSLRLIHLALTPMALSRVIFESMPGTAKTGPNVAQISMENRQVIGAVISLYLLMETQLLPVHSAVVEVII